MVKTERIIFEQKLYIKDSNIPKSSEDNLRAKDSVSIENPQHSDFIYGKEEFIPECLQKDLNN